MTEELCKQLVEAIVNQTMFGLDLNRQYGFGDFDPDAYYTPLEVSIHRIIQLCGYDYLDLRK